MFITLLTSHTVLCNGMLSPPILVSKGNLMIGYNPIYEYAALPDVQRIVAAIRKSISTKEKRAVAAVAGRGGSETEPPLPQPRPVTAPTNTQSITVPIMGEGIR